MQTARINADVLNFLRRADRMLTDAENAEEGQQMQLQPLHYSRAAETRYAPSTAARASRPSFLKGSGRCACPTTDPSHPRAGEAGAAPPTHPEHVPGRRRLPRRLPVPHFAFLACFFAAGALITTN